MLDKYRDYFDGDKREMAAKAAQEGNGGDLDGHKGIPGTGFET